jgi:hypothetical protein
MNVDNVFYRFTPSIAKEEIRFRIKVSLSLSFLS